MDEEAFRNVAADSMAQGFIVEILLTRYLRVLEDPELRAELAQSLISTGKKTDHFVGIAKTEEMAELLADVTVRMHAALEGLVGRAMARAAATSRSAGGVAEAP